MTKSLNDLAEHAIERARRGGASEAAVLASRSSHHEVKRRARAVESLEAATSRGLNLAVYVDGRFSENSTSLLAIDEIDRFVDRCLAMTRMLAPDPYRALPDPALYGPTPGVALDLWDPEHDTVSVEQRHRLAEEVEEAALSGGEAVISATATVSTRGSEMVQVHSNGFSGAQRGTAFHLLASVTARDDDGRRPEDAYYAAARHLSDLPAPGLVGSEAARRALLRRGSAKVQSGRRTLVLENRVASRLVASLLTPLSGSLLQQRRSFLDGKLGEQVAASTLTLLDDPLLPRGLGSRTFDSEGLAARRREIIREGRLQTYLVDVYYGRKLGTEPTTGALSNVVVEPGEAGPEALLAGVDDGLWVTSFLGGNDNPATGDFSFGISGMLIEKGKLTRPFGEMNVSGSHLDLWHRLAAVGNDPYPHGAWRLPTLVIEGAQVSGL